MELQDLRGHHGVFADCALRFAGKKRFKGEGGEEAEAGEGCAEEGFGKLGLDGDDGAVVDVTPGEVASALNVVHLVAEVASSCAGLVEVGGDVEGELDGREEGRQAHGRGEGEVGGVDDGGGHV